MYVFIHFLFLNILITVPSTNIRRVKTAIDNLYLEKQKLEKGDKPKKPKGGKVKARLRVEGENTVSLLFGGGGFQRENLLIVSVSL